MARAVWRLVIDDAPADGDWNMAVDRSLQLARAAGGPPTLRIYRWARPTVTLGRFQAVDAVDLEACSTYGVDVVRRMTGGRGVLHDDEVTYSVVASTQDGVPRTTSASYRYLSDGLVRAYRLLGVPADLVSRERSDRAGASACYLHSTRADLACGASKLSGSAQVWSDSVVLQHGSVTRSRDVAREAKVFRLAGDEARALEDHTMTLDRFLGTRISPERITDAIGSGFAEAMGVELEIGMLSEAELADARAILDGETSLSPARGGVSIRVF